MSEEHEEIVEGPWWRFRPLQFAVLSGILLAVTFVLDRSGTLPAAPIVGLYIVSAVLGAYHWAREAVEALGERRVNIDVLMLVAAVGAGILGLWEEMAFLAFLYGAAEGIEEWTYGRTRGAIRDLLDLAPKVATLVVDGAERDVPAEDLRPGDRFRVRPGERLVTDGVIVEGSTTLDESAVTGESVPVERGPGDEVFAGSIDLTGSIVVEATRSFADNTLSRIVEMVEEAQELKMRTQRFIDRFSSRYSPAILALGAALGVVPILFGGDPGVWAVRGITVVVAGAPCALVMSTPVAVASAISSAGKNGILIKGGAALEDLGAVEVMAFDKTGTLTAGRPAVTDVVAGASTEIEVLSLAAAIERHSEHPLAQAIVAAVDGDIPEAVGFRATAGAGAAAVVDGRAAWVGNAGAATAAGVDPGEVARWERRAGELRAEGKTIVYVGSDGQIMGLIALRDEPRPGAAAAVAALHEVGIRHVVMLTGDAEPTARAIAAALGIDDVRAELKPEDKAEVVAELEATLGATAMVGDGINDAPALATATVGIAMGAAGTDAAIEAADVALMGDDLGVLVDAARLGRRVARISRQNVVFAIGILVVLVPAAAFGILSVAGAVLAHEVSELAAVGNGLRARVRSSSVVTARDPAGTG